MKRLAGFVFVMCPAVVWGGYSALDLAQAAEERTRHQVTYDGSYYAIPYPGGDVPSGIGVCTDVVVRAYRSVGVDLQVLIHEDMTENFSTYPANWGLARPDRNIDHRRVPNLRRFFERHGKVLSISSNPADYKPGDIVSWLLPGNLPHIGVVVEGFADDRKTPLIVHNVGSGATKEDVLFRYEITGHYRYPAAS